MSLSLNGTVLLAGAGKMGTALIQGWLARGLPASSIIIQDPSLSAETAAVVRENGLRAASEFAELDEPPAVIVAAVKPQVMQDVFAPLARLVGPQTVVLSIAAGRSIASFEKYLPLNTAVVRAMPNTPAAIGRGITGAVGNAHLTNQQKAVCSALLSAVGEVVWVPEENLIDAVTAVSGSGPAYVFLLAECLAQAGVDAGLDAETATKLARATVSGAGELLRQSSLPSETLRNNVTSPGGTTAAALSVLMRADGLQQLMTEAVLAAKERGRALGQ